MDRKAASILFLSLAIFAPASLSGQEVLLPLRVEGPQISKTAFTNWEKIELTYTVGWMDGYEPVRDPVDELKPQAMNFGILELDPVWAEKVDIKNERKFEKENYFDVTYHLRYMGDKKGEIIIPGQKFAYKDLLASESAVLYFTTPEFKLTYSTVLTSDADDIKEEYDPGSYQKKATLWKASAALVGIMGIFVIIFLFRKPVLISLATMVKGVNNFQAVNKIKIDPTKIISELQINITEGNIGAVCNGLSDVIRAYVSDIKQGMTSKEMAEPILSTPHKWERERLLQVHAALCDIEDNLFVGGDNVNDKVKHHLSNLLVTVRELRPWSVYWHRRLFNLRQRLMKPLYFLNRLVHLRRP